MNWEGIVMDTIIAAIVTGIFGVVLMFLSNIFIDIRGYRKIVRKIGTLDNITLSGQHQDMKETLVSETKAIKTDLNNNFVGVSAKVDSINTILNKNEDRYENLNLDQREIRNNVIKLVSNWEELIRDNQELKQVVTELRLENEKLKNLIKEHNRNLDHDKGWER